MKARKKTYPCLACQTSALLEVERIVRIVLIFGNRSNLADRNKGWTHKCQCNARVTNVRRLIEFAKMLLNKTLSFHQMRNADSLFINTASANTWEQKWTSSILHLYMWLSVGLFLNGIDLIIFSSTTLLNTMSQSRSRSLWFRMMSQT